MNYKLFGLVAFLVLILMGSSVHAESGSGSDPEQRGIPDSDEDEDDSGDDATDDRVTGVDDSSTSTSDVLNTVPEISDDSLFELESDIDKEISGKRVKMGIGFYGQGYATNERGGQFARIVGVHKAAISLENERLVRSATVAHLGIGRETYKLERSSMTLEEGLPSGTMTFSVVKGANEVGQLELSVSKRYPNGFALYIGRLEFSDGTESEITIGLRSTPLKGGVLKAATATKAVSPEKVASATEVTGVEDAKDVIEPRDVSNKESQNEKRGWFSRLFGWGSS